MHSGDRLLNTKKWPLDWNASCLKNNNKIWSKNYIKSHVKMQRKKSYKYKFIDILM
jgi:hypothetical protein